MKANRLKLFTALLFLLAGFPSKRVKASPDGTVSYSIIETEANKYKHTVLYLDLIGFDTYFDASVSTNVRLETMIGERFMPAAEVRYSWSDVATSHPGTYPTSIGGLQKQMILDIGGVYFFRSKVKKVPVKVVLHSHSSGNYTYTKYVLVPSEVKRMVGLRGGLFSDRKALTFKEESHPYFNYKSTDGLMELPINNVGNHTGVQPAGNAYMPLAMSTTPSLYAGIHLRNIKNTIIRTSGYGKRGNTKISDLYFDLMLAPTVIIKNVMDEDGVEWQIVPKSDGIRSLGYRIGYSLHSSRYCGFIWSTEFGKRPGAILGPSFLNNGTSLTFNLGISIGSGKYLALHHKSSKKEE